MIKRSSNSNFGIMLIHKINKPFLVVMTLFFVGILVAPMGHAQEFFTLTKWGKYGTSNGSFNQPHGIAVIPQSCNEYVADE
jgi:DNA-binding beta-propeller fold protein YncE